MWVYSDKCQCSTRCTSEVAKYWTHAALRSESLQLSCPSTGFAVASNSRHFGWCSLGLLVPQRATSTWSFRNMMQVLTMLSFETSNIGQSDRLGQTEELGKPETRQRRASTVLLVPRCSRGARTACRPTENRGAPTGPAHGQDRRCHSRVATSSTKQPNSTEDGGGVHSPS